MLVLFSGGRGSGKSTIARALYIILDNANYDYVHQAKWRVQANGFYRKVVWILYFLTFFRLEVCKVFFERLYRDIRIGRAKGSLGRIYMPCVFSYHIDRLSKNKEQCVIYDSDFLTWAADKVLDGVFNISEVRDYYSSVVLPRVGKIIVVVCDTPVEDAVERWRLRENKTLSSNEVQQWIAKRTAWKKARKEILKVVSEITDVTIMILNGLDTPAQNSYNIMALLQKEKQSCKK